LVALAESFSKLEDNGDKIVSLNYFLNHEHGWAEGGLENW
jgi:hypothetical protein